MLLQAMGHLEALETGRSRKTVPPELLEACHPANTLIAGFLHPKCLFFFLIRMYLLYSVVLVSAVQQSELGMCVHISAPFWTSRTRNPSRSSQSSELSSQSYGAFSRSCCSLVKLCPTLWTVAHQISLSFTTSRDLLRFLSWVGNAIQLSHPLLPSSPFIFNLSQHQGLFHESVLCIRWPEYWSFSFSISPSSDYSGLISFRIDWLDLVAVQGTLRVFYLFYTRWCLWWFAAVILRD